MSFSKKLTIIIEIMLAIFRKSPKKAAKSLSKKGLKLKKYRAALKAARITIYIRVSPPPIHIASKNKITKPKTQMIMSDITVRAAFLKLSRRALKMS